MFPISTTGIHNKEITKVGFEIKNIALEIAVQNNVVKLTKNIAFVQEICLNGLFCNTMKH